MPPPYQNAEWSAFKGIPHRSAGPVGYIPRDWAVRHDLLGMPIGSLQLPTKRLDRAQVRAICQDPTIDVLYGYVCVMAWGLQGAGPGGYRHTTSAAKSHKDIALNLTALRAGHLTRLNAYDMFSGTNNIPHLGPAYFTKLLYFFTPKPDFYIMDQWAAKSVNLLTGRCVVRMAENAVSNLNKSGNYQAYCEEVDEIARMLGVSGEQAEEMLMSKGGPKPWPWRAHVKTKWSARSLANQ